MTGGNQKRIPELDGLRGIAILLVVFDHYEYGLARRILPLAWSGVDLFFVLSGFLIGGILLDHRESQGFFKAFYVRRACRILPLYLFWIGSFFFLAWLLSAHASAPWYEAEFGRLQNSSKWSYFLFLQNFHMARLYDLGPVWTSVTWSLCVEEQFYVLMPLIIWLTPSQKLPWVLIGVFFSVVVCRLLLNHYSCAFTYVLLPCRADGLLLGVLCAYMVRHPGIHAWLQPRRDWLYVVFGILLLGLIYLSVLAARNKTNFADFNSLEMNSYGYSWIAGFYACLLLIIVTVQDSPLAGVMRIPLLRHFGEISYCIYLIHVAVNEMLRWLVFRGKPAPTYLMVTLLAFIATWVLAAASWKYFEKPIIRWGHAFRYRKT